MNLIIDLNIDKILIDPIVLESIDPGLLLYYSCRKKIYIHKIIETILRSKIMNKMNLINHLIDNLSVDVSKIMTDKLLSKMPMDVLTRLYSIKTFGLLEPLLQDNFDNNHYIQFVMNKGINEEQIVSLLAVKGNVKMIQKMGANIPERLFEFGVRINDDLIKYMIKKGTLTLDVVRKVDKSKVDPYIRNILDRKTK
jgi:hypothetical protein